MQGSPTWGGAKGARSDKEEENSEQRGKHGQQGDKLKERVNDVAEHSGKMERGEKWEHLFQRGNTTDMCMQGNDFPRSLPRVVASRKRLKNVEDKKYES